MARHDLGDLSVPVTPEDHREMIKIRSIISLAKFTIWSTAGLLLGWMVFAFWSIYDHKNFVEADFERVLKVLSAVMPFWTTIAGTVVGYLFGKKDSP